MCRTASCGPTSSTPSLLRCRPDRHRSAHDPAAEEGLALPPGVAEPRVLDLLWHLPNGVIDRRAEPTVAEAVPGTIATLEVRVLKHKAPPRGNTKAPYKVQTARTTPAASTWCSSTPSASSSSASCPSARMRYVSGPHRALQREAADGASRLHRRARSPRDELPLLEPVYPLTAGLSGKILLKAARQALERVPRCARVAGRRLARRRAAGPASSRRCSACTGRRMPPTCRPARCPGSGSPTTSCWPASWRSPWCGRASRRSPAAASTATAASARAIADALPFALTNSQREALREIDDDMAAPRRMLRLLQGDVGSGKTVVALLAMAIAVEAGAQAALMAPTEVLARQHLDTIAPLAEKAGLRIGLLTGREKGRPRKDLLERLAARRDRHPHRHARAVPVGRGLPRPRLRRHRRAAPLRRAPAACRCSRRAAAPAPTCWS